MPLNPRRLRLWIAVCGAVLLAVVVGYYVYGQYKIYRALRRIPPKLGVNIQQSAQGFKLSKSEGGRTLFTIQAGKVTQYKEGGKATLSDVNIVVFGRNSNRFDQIYGSQFEYDPKEHIVRANGEVHIDLQGDTEGTAHPDQAPPQETKNPIHLKTSGLVFNERTGIARTDQRIEFRIPQASGSAQGVLYDSHENRLTLQSDVHIESHGARNITATVNARRGVITADPREAVLESVTGERSGEHFSANTVHLYFRQDSSIERAVATGDVRASGSPQGSAPADMSCDRAEFFLSAHNTLTHAELSGNAQFDQHGDRPVRGSAGRLLLNFKANNELELVRAVDGVRVSQAPAPDGGRPTADGSSGNRQLAAANSQGLDLTASALDIVLSHGRHIDRAFTTGSAQITITESPKPTTTAALDGRRPMADGSSDNRQLATANSTVVTAAQFNATFDSQNHLQELRGTPDAKITIRTPGQLDRTMTSRELLVAFAPGPKASAPQLTSITQTGDFHYLEGTRTAFANQAIYVAKTELLTLSGAPRYSDQGLTITADSMALNRRTSEMRASGDVKTTYADLKRGNKSANPGLLLGGAAPVHVTAPTMTAQRTSGVARYQGGARLWQDANIVEAPTIEFDRDHRSMLAQGTAQQPVTTVFVEQDKKGRMTPVNVFAARLTYSEDQRKARFDGGVTLKGADATITADSVDVYLKPNTAGPSASRAALSQNGTVATSLDSRRPMADGASPTKQLATGNSRGTPVTVTPATASGPALLEQIVAQGHIVIQQPNRRATGTKLVYTAEDGRFTLTGGPPSIFDAEHGTVTGDSLTFYTRDDRVLVESTGSSRAVTQTRINR
jgi:lipopolysaccharide export system protein LptA